MGRHQAGDFTPNWPQGTGPSSAGPPPQEDSYPFYPHSPTRDDPSARHASYDHRYSADAAQPQLQARGPNSAQLSTREPSHAGRNESQAQRQDQPYNREGSYERPYAGQPSQDQSVGNAPHQPEADHWVTPDEAYARGTGQQQPNMGSAYDAPLHGGDPEYGANLLNRQGSGHDTHLNTGGSGYDAQLGPGGSGYNTHPNTGPSAYDQSYSGGANQAQPDNSAWTGGTPAVPMHHQALHPQPMTHPMPAGFTGTYSVRRRTEHSSDSGTWFQPSSSWQQQPVPQDAPMAGVSHQADPQHSQYGQAPRQEAEARYGQYQHEPLQYQQAVPQGHDFEHAPSQYQQPQPSQDQNQQAPAQRDSFEHAPVHYQQPESRHGDSQQAVPQADQSQRSPPQHLWPEAGSQYDHRFPDQQAEPQHRQYQHAPFQQQQQQQQQPSYDYQHRQPQEQQAEPEHSQYQQRWGSQSPNQHEVDSQRNQYQHDLPRRQGSLQQQDEYSEAQQHQAQPQHEHGDRVQSQQLFPQYGQREQMPFQQQQQQQQQMLQQDRQYEHAPSDFHPPQLQYGQYSGEAVTQHQLDRPSHAVLRLPAAVADGAPFHQDEFEVEQYQHARPEQAAPTQAQHGGDAAWHQTEAPNPAQSYWRPSQHEQVMPQHEQGMPQHEQVLPQREHGAGAEEQQQAEPFDNQHEQPSLRHQQGAAHHDRYDEPGLQYQQAAPQYEPHHNLESAARLSPQEGSPVDRSAFSHRQQSEPEPPQFQQAPSQPAGREDAELQGNAPEAAMSGAEQYIPTPAQPDQFEAEQAWREPAGHAEHPDHQPASQHWQQQQQAPLPERDWELPQQQQQQQQAEAQGMSLHAQTAAWSGEAAPQQSSEEGPARSSSGKVILSALSGLPHCVYK